MSFTRLYLPLLIISAVTILSCEEDVLLSNIYGRESLYPQGNIYEMVHNEAEKYRN